MTQAICKRASQHSLNCELILVRKALRLAPRNRVCRLRRISWRPSRTEAQDASVGHPSPLYRDCRGKGNGGKARGSSAANLSTMGRGKGRKHRHSLFRRAVRNLHDCPTQSHSQERKQYMSTNQGVSQLTPEQRLAEIAACLAQGIVDLHKQGRLGTSVKEFPTVSQESLDFHLDSGLSVNSGSISDLSNNEEGATNVVECD